MKTKYEQLFAKQVKTLLRQKFVVGNSYKIVLDTIGPMPLFDIDGNFQKISYDSFGMVVSKVNFIITSEGINLSFKLLPLGTNRVGKISYYLYLFSKEDFVDGTLTGLSKKEKILKELTKICACYNVL
jgi:hypothetical protein